MQILRLNDQIFPNNIKESQPKRVTSKMSIRLGKSSSLHNDTSDEEENASFESILLMIFYP